MVARRHTASAASGAVFGLLRCPPPPITGSLPASAQHEALKIAQNRPGDQEGDAFQREAVELEEHLGDHEGDDERHERTIDWGKSGGRPCGPTAWSAVCTRSTFHPDIGKAMLTTAGKKVVARSRL